MDPITNKDRDASLAGDQEATMRMLDAMIPCARKLLARMAKPNEREEALQEIFVRLIGAISRWDEKQGAWKTFASRQVFGAIIDWRRNMAIPGFKRLGFKRAIEAGELVPKVLQDWHPPDFEESICEQKFDLDEGIELVDLEDLMEVMNRSANLRILSKYFLQFGNLKRAAHAIGYSESRGSQTLADAKACPITRARVAKLMGVDA